MDGLNQMFSDAKATVTAADAMAAAEANATVTDAYTKDGNANQPLVMIAHDLEGGLY